MDFSESKFKEEHILYYIIQIQILKETVNIYAIQLHYLLIWY